jgi:hypothetical protein
MRECRLLLLCLLSVISLQLPFHAIAQNVQGGVLGHISDVSGASLGGYERHPHQHRHFRVQGIRHNRIRRQNSFD